MGEKIRLGILGCARINKVAMIDAVAKVPEFELRAIASRHPANAERYAAEQGIAHAYGNYEALLADPSIDVVYIPLPNHLHKNWTIEALAAGKHVLVEKPLAANAVEGAAMVTAAQTHARHLIEAFHYRHHPMTTGILAQLQTAGLGDIRHIEVSLKIPAKLLEPDDIRFSFECAGGATMDLGTYGINLLRLITGATPTILSAQPTIVAPDIDGAMDVHMSFPGDIEASLACSLIHDEMDSRLQIHAEHGTILARNPFLPQFGNALSVIAHGEEKKQRFPRTTTYVYQLQALADLILRGVPSSTPASDGVINMQVLDNIYLAAGLPVRGSARC